jgi:hypothetical protein
MDHNTLITILSDMGVPGWLLRLVIAFLSDRSMILTYKLPSLSLSGGGPQGFSRLWILRRLKKLGLPKDELLDTYMKK